MKIDFGQELLGIDGKPIMDPQSQEAIRLNSVCINALMGQLEEDSKVAGEKKLARWTLACRVQNGKGPIDMTAEEIADIKDRVGKAFAPVIVGPAFLALDCKDRKA